MNNKLIFSLILGIFLFSNLAFLSAIPLCDESLKDGLVSAWGGYNGTTETFQDVISGNNLINTSGIIINENEITKLDVGTSKAINNSAINLPTDNWTLTYFVNHSQGTDNSNMFQWGGTWGGDDTNMFAYLNFGTQTYCWYHGSTSTQAGCTGVSASFNEWKMHTWVYDDSTNTLEFYVDNVSIIVMTGIYDTSSGTNLLFGTDVDNILGSFVGSFKNILLYNKTLTPSEIDTLFNSSIGCSMVEYPVEEEPAVQMSETGQIIYSTMNTLGAGLGIFLQILSQALPILLIGLAVVVMIVIIIRKFIYVFETI